MSLRLSTLRARLLFVIALALAPPLALSVYNYAGQRRQAVASAQQELLRLARLASDRYARVIDAGRQLLMAVAEVPSVRARDPACSPLLTRLRQQHPAYLMMAVYEPSGDYTCGSLPPGTRLSVADRGYFRRAMETRSFAVGEYQVGRVTHKPNLALAYPLPDGTEKTEGVVTAVVDLAWLNDLAATLQLPAGTLLMVLDRNGTVLVRSPDPQSWVGRPAPEGPIADAMRSSGEGLAKAAGPDGVPRLFAFTPLGTHPSELHLSIGVPESAVLAGPNRVLATSLVYLGLVSGAVLTIAWVGSSVLVLRPARALLQATRRLAGGHLEARSALPAGPGELSELGQAFDEMAATLARAFAETERRRTEAEASEMRYRSLFEGVPVGLFRSTPAGEILDVNPAFARMLGYPDPAAMRAGGVGELWLDPGDRLEWRERLERQGLVVGFETRLRHRDGGTIWVRSASRAVRDAEGRVLHYEGVVEDVTERKRAEEVQAGLQSALEKAAEEWARTFDSIETPILILDPEARVLRANEAARVASGHARYENMVGRPVAELGAGEPWPAAAELARAVQAARSAAPRQVRDHTTGRTWEVAASLATGIAATARTIVVARDLTAMVELQDSLRRSETLSAMGSLVAGVAHEVRNPLFGISANLDAFEAQAGGRAEFSEIIALLRAEVDRLAALMHDLLEYGKPVRLEPSPGALEPVLDRAVAACARLAATEHVQVVHAVPRGLPPVVMDSASLVRAIQNLVQNAVQHSPPGSAVAVDAEEERPKERAWVRCTVRDSGPGIPPEDLSRIFEPFYTRRRGGTGLGLSIVQRVVEEHGGRVWAENRPEGGAALIVRLPCLRS